jgi:hypothetical protein
VDTAGLQQFLGRIYLEETRRYILHLGSMLARRKPPSHRSARGRFQPPHGPYQRKKPHAQPCNESALKHGFFSHNPPEASPQDLLAARVAKLDDDIVALRLLLRRALTLASDSDNPSDALRLLDLFGLSAARLSRMLINRQKMRALDVAAALEPSLLENASESEVHDQPE